MRSVSPLMLAAVMMNAAQEHSAEDANIQKCSSGD
jgi:hypothetical protein